MNFDVCLPLFPASTGPLVTADGHGSWNDALTPADYPCTATKSSGRILLSNKAVIWQNANNMFSSLEIPLTRSNHPAAVENSPISRNLLCL